MQRFPHLAVYSRATALALLSLTAVEALPKKDPVKPPTVRWEESQPGCTFSRSDDGKYRYGLWDGDVGVTLAVDSQEIEKVRRRSEPFFSVWLSVRYRGKDRIEVMPDKATLEFVTHFKVNQNALDPDNFSAQVQDDADQLDHETARDIEKHPELKETKEAYMRAFQKDSAELVEFVSKNSLRAANLDAGNPEVSGWVLFSTKNKWLGGWKRQEEFVLRWPVAGKIFEFPFKLPPNAGELVLRHRE
jgi:hypothetical protein